MLVNTLQTFLGISQTPDGFTGDLPEPFRSEIWVKTIIFDNFMIFENTKNALLQKELPFGKRLGLSWSY